jgi:hypothetical protein
MKHIYFDTNQMYYIRRCADESAGWDYGSYEWAYRVFPRNPEQIRDIRELCYIVALQDEWALPFSTSDASFAELTLARNRRAQPTREAWRLLVGAIDEDRLELEARLPHGRSDECPEFSFIEDPDDRGLLRHFVSEGADVFLTSDTDILAHQDRLGKMGISVMRPSQWLDEFLLPLRGSEDAVDWLERVLFGIGKAPA